MDLINNRTKEIAHMALNGLYERSKAISANTANALTPGYQRKEVSFENSPRPERRGGDRACRRHESHVRLR
jgi:flagellar basal-body rod protein FlgB